MYRDPSAQGGLSPWGAGDLDVEVRSDTAVIPDAFLLFNSDFIRSGRDLLVVSDDGRRVVVQDYFAHEKRPTLASPQGATIQGFVVDAIVAQTSPKAYAQAGTPASAATPSSTSATSSTRATSSRRGRTRA